MYIKKLVVHGLQKILLIAVLLLCHVSLAIAENYYVSATTGDDSNNGLTIETAFKTISKAVSVLKAGDTCFIRGGDYHEEVIIGDLGANEAQPITITAYNNEQVTLNGSLPVEILGSNGWELYKGNIYKTTLNQDISQVFYNNEWMMLARWPNARFDKGEAWDQTRWAQGDESRSANGTLYDTPSNGHDLAASGLDMTGAMAILNVGSFTTEARPITSHTPGSAYFDYVPVSHYKDVHHHYFIDSKLKLLDQETEWYFDQATRTLYLHIPGGGVPEPGSVRAKTQNHALIFRESRYVTVSDIDFFATTFKLYKSEHITVEDCDLKYPSFNRRVLGDYGEVVGTRIEKSSYTTILNCSFAYTDSLVMKLANGHHNTVENSEFHHLDYTGAHHVGNSGAIWFRNDRYGTFRRNTLYISGPSEGIMTSSDMTIELNDISSLSHLQNDGAYTALGKGHQRVIVKNNWFHKTLKPSARFSDGPKNYLPDYMRTGLLARNVTFDAGTSLTFMIKGDEREVYNNLSEGSLLFVDFSGDPESSGIHANSKAINNATGSYIDFIAPERTEHNNWESSQNSHVSIKTQVRDWNNRDFRPTADSGLIDAGVVIPGITDGYIGSAPDIGAYEAGADRYWIPGRRQRQAATPVPKNGGKAVKLDADLMWLEAYKTDRHQVWFGTDPRRLQPLGTFTQNIANPGSLASNTVYYWRVDAIQPDGVTTGNVWAFDTTEPQGPREVVLTADAANSTRPWRGLVAFTLNDAFAYHPANPTVTRPAQRYNHSNGYHAASPEGEDVVLEYTVSTGMTELREQDTLLVDLYGRNNCCYDRDDHIDITLYDGHEPVAVSAANKIIDKSPFHTRVKIPGPLQFDRVRLTAHDTTGHNGNSFTLMEIRAAIETWGAGNVAPVFITDTLSLSKATIGTVYHESIAPYVIDADLDTLTFEKVDGPQWLVVSENGSLSGIPRQGDEGESTVTVNVIDSFMGTVQQVFSIDVVTEQITP